MILAWFGVGIWSKCRIFPPYLRLPSLSGHANSHSLSFSLLDRHLLPLSGQRASLTNALPVAAVSVVQRWSVVQNRPAAEFYSLLVDSIVPVVQNRIEPTD
jgi:hypothetical protein